MHAKWGYNSTDSSFLRTQKQSSATYNLFPSSRKRMYSKISSTFELVARSSCKKLTSRTQTHSKFRSKRKRTEEMTANVWPNELKAQQVFALRLFPKLNYWIKLKISTFYQLFFIFDKSNHPSVQSSLISSSHSWGSLFHSFKRHLILLSDTRPTNF